MAPSPATSSSVSWKPAVPPPPVTGAAVGIGVAVVVVVTVGVGVGVRVTVRVARGVSLEVTPGVLVAEELPAEGVSPDLPAEAEAVIVLLPEVITVGEMTVGVVGDDDEVHAASATGASRTSAPQYSAVSRTPSVVPRTFMGPLLKRLADDESVSRSWRQKPVRERKHAAVPAAARAATGRSPKAPAAARPGRKPTLTCNGLFTIGLLG
jgi:hypothetical protein